MRHRLVAVLVAGLVLAPPWPGVARSNPVAAGVPTATTPAGVWPLDPEPAVVRGFDLPEADWVAGHRGVDLAGRPGQVVRAALGGRVGFVGSIGGKPVVTVLHGGRRTTYEPVEAILARGEPVRAGDPIGRLVTRSGHCFPDTCLHWGLREGETYLDPLSLLGGGPVRLLPLWRDRPAAAPLPVLAVWSSPLAALAGLRVRLGGGPAGRPVAADRW